jgi:N6-adenosine-specific RNA methylase IME4
MVWIKPVASKFLQGQLFINDELFKMGGGYTTRQNAEYVVLGKRGNPPQRLSKKVRQVIVEPAREHSRKPEKSYASIEQYGAGPYLELFGRQRRRGWTVRGDEADKFNV